MNPEDVQRLAPTLFLILFALIAVNCAMFFSYYLQDKNNRLTRHLFAYWLIQLATFVAAPMFMEGHLQMAIPFSSNIFIIYYFYRSFFADYAPIPSYKKYFLIFFAAAWPMAIALEFLFGHFTLTTMPLAVATSLPMFKMLSLVIFDKEKRFRTFHHKWAFAAWTGGIIHTFNFAIFRNDPGALIWGLTVHILLVAVMGIVIANFHNYMLHKTENERLDKLVKARTFELNERFGTLQRLKEDKDRLFKVVLHDISNPMSSVIGYLTLLEGAADQEKRKIYSNKAMKSANSVANIIRQVRAFESTEKENPFMFKEPINLKEAFEMVEMVYAPIYEKKEVSLNILTPEEDVVFYGNKELFIHSVLGNLLSNSLKFSNPGGAVLLKHKLEQGFLNIVVKDQGQGIKKEMLPYVFDFGASQSTQGTRGERGHGFGLPLLKRYMDSVSGEVNIESKAKDEHEKDHGTEIELLFEISGERRGEKVEGNIGN